MKARIITSLVLITVIAAALFTPVSTPAPAQAQDKIVIGMVN